MPRNAVCPTCGAPAAEDARFCNQCGERLSGSAESTTDSSTLLYLVDPSDPTGERRLLTEDEAAAVGALPAGCAFLIAHRGPAAGSRYLLDHDRITIGRNSDNDICLPDITVSRHHLELLRETDGYHVHDLASLNGTYVNRDRVDLTALNDGDEIRVGKFSLTYFGSPAGG